MDWSVLMKKSNPHKAVLTKWERNNLDGYVEMFGKGRCFNLGQSHASMPIKSQPGRLFTIIKNFGMVWYEPLQGQGRFLAPIEVALYQAMPVRLALTTPRAPDSATQIGSSPFSKHDAARSRTGFGGTDWQRYELRGGRFLLATCPVRTSRSE